MGIPGEKPSLSDKPVFSPATLHLERRYRELWWSKVLFDPEGHVLKCCTLDYLGIPEGSQDGPDILRGPIGAHSWFVELA